MMMKGMVWAMRAQREPYPEDTHPLAREDGGWYPGKRFDPTDVFTDPGNWEVWKQFLVFFFSMLCIPVGSFIAVEWICRRAFGMRSQRSLLVGVIVSMVAIQALMIFYAKLAVQENNAEYTEEQKKLIAEKEKKAAAQLATPALTPNKTSEDQPTADPDGDAKAAPAADSADPATEVQDAAGSAPTDSATAAPTEPAAADSAEAAESQAPETKMGEKATASDPAETSASQRT